MVEPEQLSMSSCNAIWHLRAVQTIELKQFKAATIEVAYAKRGMSKHWKGYTAQPSPVIGQTSYNHDGWCS